MPIVQGAQTIVAGMTLGPLALGYNPIRIPAFGQSVGDAFVDGFGANPFARGVKARTWPFTIWLGAPGAIAGNPAGSQAANEALARQVEELAGNSLYQPVPIAWSGARGLPQDGWYIIQDCAPDYSTTAAGRIKITFQVTYKSPGTIRRMQQSLVGGALASSYSGAAINWASFPLNSTPSLTTMTRTGSEGAIPILISPLLNPVPYQLSATSSDWWKGGVHVYDTLIAGGNAVPTDGTAVNANWLEVFGTDHAFLGDILILNGLQLFRLQVGVANQTATLWLWSTGLGTAAWQQWSTLQYLDNSFNVATLRQASLEWLGPEEVALRTVATTSAGNVGEALLRLPRGTLSPRVEFRPKTQSNSVNYAIQLSLVSGAKIVYHSTAVVDVAVGVGGTLAPTTDFGYAAAIIANSANPFLAGLCWQNSPTYQPASSSATVLGVGDASGPAQNTARQYGVFAVPFANPQNLQAEAELGTLGTGWSSIADAAASAGNTAKVASGTLAGNADLFGTAWSPAAGKYDLWVRARVTANAGTQAEMTIGVWNPTTSSYVASGTATANQFATTYTWVRFVQGVSLPAANATQFRAVSALTLGTDWFIDEVVLVPTSSTTSYGFPQDIGQQWLFDKAKQERVLA